MVDRPVIGQIGRTDEHSQSKIEVIGQLTEQEWKAFYECIVACAKPYAPRLSVRMQTYSDPIPILRHLPKKPKVP